MLLQPLLLNYQYRTGENKTQGRESIPMKESREGQGRRKGEGKQARDEKGR